MSAYDEDGSVGTSGAKPWYGSALIKEPNFKLTTSFLMMSSRMSTASVSGANPQAENVNLIIAGLDFVQIEVPRKIRVPGDGYVPDIASNVNSYI